MWEFFKTLTNPESIIQYGGLWLLLFVLFAETGLLIGFFLPGDSLVFISGLICATSPQLLGVNIFVLMSTMCFAAIVGNMFGYYFGYKAGESLYEKKDSLIFKKSHLLTTKVFYEKHGGKTIVLGRFLPIVRTFAPILAGVIKIDFKKFMLYNIIGAVAWINSIGLAGYFLGQKFPDIKNYLGYIIIGFIVVTTIPVLRTYLKSRKQ
jgi:membrane-associated protein